LAGAGGGRGALPAPTVAARYGPMPPVAERVQPSSRPAARTDPTLLPCLGWPHARTHVVSSQPVTGGPRCMHVVLLYSHVSRDVPVWHNCGSGIGASYEMGENYL
jgi:hypothetical protein